MRYRLSNGEPLRRRFVKLAMVKGLMGLNHYPLRGYSTDFSDIQVHDPVSNSWSADPEDPSPWSADSADPIPDLEIKGLDSF